MLTRSISLLDVPPLAQVPVAGGEPVVGIGLTELISKTAHSKSYETPSRRVSGWPAFTVVKAPVLPSL